MPDLPEGIDSTFRYILIAAKRAEQLIHGARARVTTRHVKPTTVALAELAAADVPWRKVTAEEYEMLLQQEVAAKEAEEHAPVLFPIPCTCRISLPIRESTSLSSRIMKTMPNTIPAKRITRINLTAVISPC